MKINIDDISNLIRASAAQYIMPRFNMLQASEIDTKSGPTDLVTIADRETEEALDEALSQMFPGCVVIGEESISAGTKSISSLQDESGMVWVTDPVDGTHNFVHGSPEFAVMLACVIKGETRHGWIYDVPGDRMLYAELGGGAYIEGERLKVAAAKPLQDVKGFIGRKYFSKEIRPIIEDFKAEVQTVNSLHCAGHEYTRVASGVYDFSIYNSIRPWDHLPGTLAVTEAGGVVKRWDGRPYTPRDDLGGLISASNPDLMDELQTRLISKFL